MSQNSPGAMPRPEPSAAPRGGHNRSSRARRSSTGLLLGGLVTLMACEGDNLFRADPGSQLPPQVTQLAVPDSAVAGRTLSVQVEARATRGVARIDVSVLGGASKDTSIVINPPQKEASAVVSILLPPALLDTLVLVGVTATDSAGVVSKPRTATIRAVGPPVVLSVSQPPRMAANDLLTVQVSARGFREISKLRAVLQGAVSKDTTINIVPPVKDLSQSISIRMPSAFQDTTLTLAISAIDLSGRESQQTVVNVPLTIGGPQVTELTAPDSAKPGGVVDFRVSASAPRQVSKITLQFRGAVTQDSIIEFDPPRGQVTQDISYRLPAGITDSRLIIRVTATDQASGLSSVRADTVLIDVGAPQIVTLQPSADSVKAGGTLDVRVRATGSRAITRIDLAVRGAVDLNLSAAIAPAATDVTRDFSISIPTSAKDTRVILRASAIDAAGAVSAIREDTVRVTNTAAPTVTSTATPNAVPSGTSFSINVRATDQIGLRYVGYEIRDAGGTVIARDSASLNGLLSKDTTFIYTVPGTQAPTVLRVAGFARDDEGFRSSSVESAVSVTDGAPPTITRFEPIAGTSVPLQQQLRVRVRVQDPSGLKKLEIRGFAIRADSLTNADTVARFNTATVEFPQPGVPLFPTDTTITRLLTPTAHTETENVYVVTVAEDAGGNIAVDSVLVLVGGPKVVVDFPENGITVSAGGKLRFQVTAIDSAKGVDSMKVTLSGLVDSTFVRRGLASAKNAVLFDSLFVPNTAGTITLTASAWSGITPGTLGNPITINVVSGGVADLKPPTVSRTVDKLEHNIKKPLTTGTFQRMELDDTLVIRVVAEDSGSSGTRYLGFMAELVDVPAGVVTDTIIRRDTVGSLVGTVPFESKLLLRDFGISESNMPLPDSVLVRVTAFAVDSAGNCATSISTSKQSLICGDTIVYSGETAYRPGSAGSPPDLRVIAVLGSTVHLPGDCVGCVIADAVVDTLQRRLFLSNLLRNQVEVLELSDTTFRPSAIRVGSRPWGLFIGGVGSGGALRNDTLIIANSGGTNISYVPIDTTLASPLLEDEPKRLLTPNVVLWEVERTTDQSGRVVYVVHDPIDFSDRPQFLAQDSLGNVVYSTVPTPSAPDGTIRIADTNPNALAGDTTEVRIFYDYADLLESDGFFAIAHVDSVRSNSGGITIYDHTPGFPGTRFSVSGPPDSLQAPLTAAGSDGVIIQNARWDKEAIALSDTTFLAASGDRGEVAIGEGNTAPAGRIMVYRAQGQAISDAVAVRDLINNASERVNGLALNRDGALGAARGALGAYYFTGQSQNPGELRLQGVFQGDLGENGAGAALHPSHTGIVTSGTARLSFIGTEDQTIKIIDTVNFIQVGELHIRTSISGPLRATPPLPGDNTGLLSTDPNYIVVKLYGVTVDADGKSGVIVINVRNRDIS